MAKSKRPPEQKRNGYDDDDLRQIYERRVAAKQKRDAAISEARAACKRELKVIEAEGKAVGVLPDALKRTEAILHAQAVLQAEAAKTKPDEIELVEDMVKVLGGFADTPLGSAALAAVDAEKVAQAKFEAAEQADGEAVLDELASESVH